MYLLIPFDVSELLWSRLMFKSPRRAKLLAHGRERVKEVPEIADFVFVDVNCRVGIKTTEGELKFFNSIEDFDGFLNDQE